MADTRLLLAGLLAYRDSLGRHLRDLEDEYRQLEIRWHAFSGVYEGDAADQFKYGWDRTAHRFGYYVERTAAIARVLDERIEALREADRQEAGLLE